MKNVSIKQLSNSLNKSKVSALNKEKILEIKKITEQQNSKAFINLILKYTGLTVTPEFKFCTSRMWRIDFAIINLKIAIEIEGGVFVSSSYIDSCGNKIIRTGGRHNTGKGFINDMEKYNTLASENWLLIRTTPKELLSKKTLDFIIKAISARS